MPKPSSQKFIARNRAPRVQIEYDVELYGAQKKVQIPFVMGVMSDLSGDARDELPPVDERKFVNIDAENLDDRMKSINPRVAINVPNTLTGQGNLAVDIRFESLEDFSPRPWPARSMRSASCSKRVRSSPISSFIWTARPARRI